MSERSMLSPFVRRGRSESIWRAFTLVVAVFAPFAGGALLYSDATGQRPIYTEAVVGLFLIWVGWMTLCVLAVVSVDWSVADRADD